MAKIHEEFTIVDRFSGVLDRLISKFDRVSEAAERAKGSANGATNEELGGKTSIRVDILDRLADGAQRLSNVNPGGVWGRSWADVETRLTNVSLRLRGIENDGAPEKVESRFVSAIKKIHAGFTKLRDGVGKLRDSLKKLGTGNNPLLSQTFRIAAALFTVRKIISYIKNALELLPEDVKGPWTELTNLIKKSFAGGIGAFIQGMSGGLKKLTAALESASGQRFLRGLEHSLRTIGAAIGWAMDKLADLVTWLGNNFEVVAAAAAIVLTYLTVKMLAFAGATLLANLPLVLLIALVAGLIAHFQSLGYTAADIFGGIGRVIGWFYVFFGNIIIEIQNILADFAEFFGNLLDDPAHAILRLLIDLADGCLGILENLAKGIDAIFGSNLAGAVTGWRDKLKGFEDSLPEQKVKFEHWENLDYDEVMNDFEMKGREFGEILDNLGSAVAVPVKNIDENTGSIAKSVSKTEEDIKSLVDLATRKYINNINLTAQTPVINVTGANTGNTPEDRRALAAAIRDIIVEQAASGSVRTTARAF